MYFFFQFSISNLKKPKHSTAKQYVLPIFNLHAVYLQFMIELLELNLDFRGGIHTKVATRNVISMFVGGWSF